MNNKEYWSQADAQRTPNYKMIHTKLEKWRLENNITETCIVHHRDDTEECLKYNSEHYERWGLNEDGTFEYGKYIVFMTLSEHSVHHNTGKKHSEETREKISAAQKGKKLSDVHRAKISAAHKGERHPMYGKHHSEETLEKMSAAQKGKRNPMYGKHHSEETRAKISAAHKGERHPMYSKHHSEETLEKMSAAQKGMSVLYTAYKNNGGILKWNEFKKALKNGEITFEVQPITVYTK